MWGECEGDSENIVLRKQICHLHHYCYLAVQFDPLAHYKEFYDAIQVVQLEREAHNVMKDKMDESLIL